MTQGERVKEIRKSLGLTMEKFGEHLGVTKTAISLIESGKNNLTDANIKALCREFNVREEWLRDGSGDKMFHELSQDEEVAFIVGHTLPQAPDFVKDAFISLGKLSQEFTPDDWQAVRKFIDALAGKK